MQGHISFAKNAMHKSLATTATQRQKKRGTGGITMAEYIEREALLHAMKMDVRPPFAVVRDFPAADVVEVVRCKECKYYKKGSCDCHSVWPDQYSTGYDCRPDDDDFCSYGEREDKQSET